MITQEKLNQVLTRDSKFKIPLSKKEKLTYLDIVVQHKDYVEAINYLEEQQKSVCLNRLKEQYKFAVENEESEFYIGRLENYQSVRAFCLDTLLISFDDIELMEDEVNQSF